MPTQNETARIADAINALRPDWPVRSLKSFIQANLGDRAYRDVAIAMTWVACDPASQTPKRVVEAGPWWLATNDQQTVPRIIGPRCVDHPDQKAATCSECDKDAVPAPTDLKARIREAQETARIEREQERQEAIQP